MLKQFTTSFYELSKQNFLRPNFGYRYFFDIKNGKIWDIENIISLKYVLKEIETEKEKKGELEEFKILVELGNIERRKNYLINLEKVSEIGSNKAILEKGDIVIPKLQPKMGNMFLNLEHKKYLASTELLEYKVLENFNPIYIYYLITHKVFLKYLENLESGKTHRRVNSDELFNIKIPNLPKSQQDKIVSKIEPIENEIKRLKSQIKEQKEVINDVFAREFGFDEKIAFEFGKGMTALTQNLSDRKLKINFTNFEELAKSEILRVSTRFHNEPTKKLMGILDGIKTIDVNKIIKSYEKGVQPEYDTNGDVHVVKIANLKNGYIDFSETEKININYFNGLKEEKKLKENDIIICATGKGSLGKIDLFEGKNEAITAADNYVIRVNEKIKPLFFTYYFRSILGFFQVERDYTGATNQIHLYWDQIGKWKIPDISLTYQQKIVDEIKKELDEQEIYKNKIEDLRGEIDEIIEESLR